MKIKFGLGRRCINPELPISLAGYFNKRMWNEVLDDLEVRAVVLKSGGEYAAIIQFDLLCINYKLYRAVEKLVKKADIDDISIKNLLICATHTHTAPDINGDPNSEMCSEFAAAKAVEALEDAAEELTAGELLGGMASETEQACRRDQSPLCVLLSLLVPASLYLPSNCFFILYELPFFLLKSQITTSKFFVCVF